MAKPVQMFEAENGKPFKTMHDALKEDLREYLMKAAGNEAITRNIVDHLCSDDEIRAFATLIVALRDEHPHNARAISDGCVTGTGRRWKHVEPDAQRPATPNDRPDVVRFDDTVTTRAGEPL